ncbi:MAG: HAMP domain-containing sensor histidine kinase [Balneolales bacterium]
MNIRGKLSVTFILLLIFGVTAVSSYSILFIRAFLLDEGVRQMQDDGRWMIQTIQYLPAGTQFPARLDQVGQAIRYHLVIYDETGMQLKASPAEPPGMYTGMLPDSLIRELTATENEVIMVNEKETDFIYAFAHLPRSVNEAHYLQISQAKDEIFKPIATIRWIIYTGMFISIGLIVIVSTLFARYLSRPIVTLNKAARRIAEGDVNYKINLRRKDEFGALSDSLNQMASRLREDNAQLQQINEKQRLFLADIAHEVRNPLHTIMGSLEMLEMNELNPDKRKKYLANAASHADRLSRLFSDLMTLQRYSSDENFIREKVFDLSGITRKMDEWYREEADNKGVDLSVDKQSLFVEADPGKIEQVLENLISNALKFTAEGHVHLRYEEEKDNVVVKVTDTGTGIPHQHLPRLFDRFYRMDKARSRDRGGTGLGLAIVKSILDAHGREVHVESREGHGSEFSFRLKKAPPPPA